MLNILNGLAHFHFGTVHYQFMEYQFEYLKFVRKQFRAWSDCMDGKGLMLSVLAL
jgi:hypothetical protein